MGFSDEEYEASLVLVRVTVEIDLRCEDAKHGRACVTDALGEGVLQECLVDYGSPVSGARVVSSARLKVLPAKGRKRA